MFGYVKPYTPEMKMSEYELYRAIYCGLCRSMGRVTGEFSRLTLSYDFVFLAAVRMLLSGETPEISSRRCAAHPMKRRASAEDCEALRYTARAAALLNLGKLKDDISDERGISRLKAGAAYPTVQLIAKRACRSESEDERRVIGELSREISEGLDKLDALEKGEEPTVDKCADAFGDITSSLLRAGFTGAYRRIAEEIGRGVGRFIYVADALDDLRVDYKKKRSNPILRLYGKSAVVLGDKEKVSVSMTAAESVMTAALLDLDRTAKAAELICDGGDTGIAAIVRNILYVGMPEVLRGIIKNNTQVENT